MVRSLGIKLAMLGVTLVLVWWIRWPVPEPSRVEISQSVLQQHSVRENERRGDVGRVNINAGTLEELEALPGIGAVIGQRILDYRKRHGGFSSINELEQIHGIGKTRLARLRPLVTVRRF